MSSVDPGEPFELPPLPENLGERAELLNEWEHSQRRLLEYVQRPNTDPELLAKTQQALFSSGKVVRALLADFLTIARSLLADDQRQQTDEPERRQ